MDCDRTAPYDRSRRSMALRPRPAPMIDEKFLYTRQSTHHTASDPPQRTRRKPETPSNPQNDTSEGTFTTALEKHPTRPRPLSENRNSCPPDWYAPVTERTSLIRRPAVVHRERTSSLNALQPQQRLAAPICDYCNMEIPDHTCPVKSEFDDWTDDEEETIDEHPQQRLSLSSVLGRGEKRAKQRFRGLGFAGCLRWLLCVG